jgi:hypothetical protein
MVRVVASTRKPLSGMIGGEGCQYGSLEQQVEYKVMRRGGRPHAGVRPELIDAGPERRHVRPAGELEGGVVVGLHHPGLDNRFRENRFYPNNEGSLPLLLRARSLPYI